LNGPADEFIFVDRRLGRAALKDEEMTRMLGDEFFGRLETKGLSRMKRGLRSLSLLLILGVPAAACAQADPDSAGLIRYLVSPQAADSTIKRFTEPSYVVLATSVADSAPLLVYLPGTNGEPRRATLFANTAARQGYRVIALTYNDVPAVQQICPRDPDPRCAERVRMRRIFGIGRVSQIDDRPEESIVNRLVMLLRELDRDHPGQGWAGYLSGGEATWGRIAVSGLSQGAGMAAYIAQQKKVARVVLFSSPWDSYGRPQTMAQWIDRGPGVTPRDRWFAAYHAKEQTADLIRRSCDALEIPRDHLRVFTLEPNGNAEYHPSGVANGATPRALDGTPALSARLEVPARDARAKEGKSF
jgi:hypothetical protein